MWVRRVSQRFGAHQALRDVTLTLGPGLNVVLGANGAGKSTLLKIMATVLSPSRGTMGYGDWHWPRDAGRLRSQLGYVPQGGALNSYVSPREWIAAAAVQRGLGSFAAAASLADDLLATLGVDVRELGPLARSAGRVQQWALVAQSLLGEPPVWILDEPTQRLGPADVARLEQLLSARSATATVILATHLGPSLIRRAQRVVVMGAGAVLADGAPGDIAAAAAGQVRVVRWPLDRWALAGEGWLAAAGRQGAVATEIYPRGESVAVRVVGAMPVPAGVEEEPAAPTVEDGHQALLRARPRAGA